MVTIISNKGDYTTNRVIDWIDYFKGSFHRINSEDLLGEDFHLEIGIGDGSQNFVPEFGPEMGKKTKKSVWFRRDATLIRSVKEQVEAANISEEAKALLIKNAEKELMRIKAFIYSQYFKDFALGNFEYSSPNKLEVLDLASDCGLDIPATTIINSRTSLQKFANKYKEIITKSIYESVMIHHNTGFYTNYAEEVSNAFIEQLPDRFFPSLFQEKLQKKYEIRAFYLDGKWYSMAIFSQLDEQTSIDFRRYNTKKGNRNIPYALPEKSKIQLSALMRILRLNTGSVDLVKTLDGKLVFLEVNPVGQFGMVSTPCNYHLHREVAKFLLHE